MNPLPPAPDKPLTADASPLEELPSVGMVQQAQQESQSPASMAEPAAVELKADVITRPRMLEAMEHRDFFYLWAGNFLSNVGTWMQNIALGWLVLQLTNSAFWLGVVSFASAVPLVVFTLLGGVIADHVDKRKMLIGTQVVMMVAAFLLAGLTYLNRVTVTQIIVLALITGLASALATPSQQALLPQLVPRRILSNAVGLNSAQFNMSRVLGPTIGGFAMAWFGVSGNFFLNGLSFVAVIFALWHMHYPAQSAIPETSFWARLAEGFRYVFGNPKTNVLVLLVSAGGLLGVPYLSFVPYFARDILQRDARGLGLLMAASGLGAFFAAITIAYIGKPRHRGKLVFATGVLFFAAIIGFTASRLFLMSFVMQMVAGYCLIIMVAIINTRLQLLASDELRGRTMSIYATAYLGLPPIGSFAAGWLSRWMHPHVAIGGMAALGLLAFVVIFALNRELWALD
ncbi:MAG TPA: MFS transporter [Terriglobales bacterium]|nr:MFS transporter [Terriglobales bacterium]